MLKLAITPFDLTTRSRSAALSLLLGDAILTLSPADLGDAENAALHAASFAEFAQAWAWTRDLWHEAILNGALGATFAAQSQRAWERVGSGTLIASSRKRDEPTPALDAARLIRDIARGGGGSVDPSVRLAIEAGLMRSCAKHAVAFVRDAGDSMLERLIGRSTEPMARVTLPIPDMVDEEIVIELRRMLEPTLTPVRSAIEEVIAVSYAGADPPRVRAVCDRRVAPLAEALVREAVSLENAVGRAAMRAVSVRIGVVSSDVVIRAAEQAVRGKADSTSPALVAEETRVVVLSVKPMAWDAASI